jgi:hypothetical protein
MDAATHGSCDKKQMGGADLWGSRMAVEKQAWRRGRTALPRTMRGCAPVEKPSRYRLFFAGRIF